MKIAFGDIEVGRGFKDECGDDITKIPTCNDGGYDVVDREGSCWTMDPEKLCE